MKISDFITENYDNWDHPQPADYSKHLEKTFGAPDEITDEQTVWHNIDGFKRVVVRDEYILHGSPAPHYDFVYSYIDLEVDEDLSDELAKCSGSILIDHLKNEVGARCGSLTANAVTLNFCLDVVHNRTKPVPEEYESRIKAMKQQFADGERYENDWWEDKSGDADPSNPYYADDVDEGTRCWKGYEKKGMKTMFGKRVPNCVKREQSGEAPKGDVGAAATQKMNFFDLSGDIAKWPGWIRSKARPDAGILGFKTPKDGTSGAKVVQKWLKGLGYDIKVDDKFGPTTSYAIDDAVKKIRSGEIELTPPPTNFKDKVKDIFKDPYANLRKFMGRPTYLQNDIDEASSPWTSSGKHPEDMDRDELQHEIDIFKQYQKMGMSLSPQEIMRLDALYDYLDTVDDRALDEDLRAWFGKGKKGGAGGGGWDRYNTKGERIGKCGDSKPGEGKPKCLSKSKAAKLRAKGGKKAIAAAVRKKRRNDPNPDRRGKAKNVSNTKGK